MRIVSGARRERSGYCSCQRLATKLLSDETTRGLFLDVVYELLKRDGGWDLMQTAR